MAERFGGKILERSADFQFLRRFSNFRIWYYKALAEGRCVVQYCGARSRSSNGQSGGFLNR